jgi:hypothetical protein
VITITNPADATQPAVIASDDASDTYGDADPYGHVRRIGFWGAPGSGKTTFLAALNVAIIRSREDLMIFGTNDESTAFLAENTDLLTRRGQFPHGTRALTPLRWVIRMRLRVPAQGRFGRKVSRIESVPFVIDLLDAPGGMFAPTPSSATTDAASVNARLGFDMDDDEGWTAHDIELAFTPPDEQLTGHLRDSVGIVFIIDPIREFTHGDAYYHFHGTLLKIAQQLLAERGSADLKLPHHVAVCVTKFDDPMVYERARDGGYCSYAQDDPSFFPRVHDDMAADFFSDLCKDPSMRTAELVAGTLGKYFYPENVRYFITSGIGFNVDDKGRFDERAYENVELTGSGQPRILGAIHPINVIEPLIWLGQSLSTSEQ